MDGQPRSVPSTFKVVILGCGGALILGLVGAGGCAVALVIAHRNASEIANVGTEYLKTEPRIARALGTVHTVDRKWTGVRVSADHGRGEAHFEYTVLGTSGNGEAEVWLTRASGGSWQVTGALVQPGPLNPKSAAGLIRLGTPGPSPLDPFPKRN